MVFGVARTPIQVLSVTGWSIPSLGLGLILPLSTSRVVVKVTIKWHYGGGV